MFIIGQLPPCAEEPGTGNDVTARGAESPAVWLVRSRDVVNSQSASDDSDEDRYLSQEIERVTSSVAVVARSVKVISAHHYRQCTLTNSIDGHCSAHGHCQ